MKALVYTGVETLDYRDVPMPEPTEGQALVKILASGICGSDMHAYLGHDERRPAPLILGHEAAGIVQGGAMDGQRVTINPLVSCMACEPCLQGRTNICADRMIISMPPREGAFAEWVAISEGNLVPVPDGTPLEHAALAEPIACGWHAARLSLPLVHASAPRALVIGGGAIGMGAALSLQAQGLADVTLIEPHDARRAYIADRAPFDVGTEADLKDAQFDVVIDGVGFDATRALSSARAKPGGVIAHIGLGSATGGLDIRRMTLQEITFIGTYTYTAEDFRQTAKAIFDGSLGALDWITTQPLATGADAFAAIRSGSATAPKTILIPTHEGGNA